MTTASSQTRFPIATWNVLHRVHAVNWREPAIVRHADEDVRVAAIAARARELADVVCLQEVSGDQHAAIAAAIGGQASVIAMRYPRVPRYFRPAERGALPRDHAEYLVTIAPPGARELHAAAFTTDPGKGLLVVEVGDVVVINTHVSYGDKHAGQCAQIAEIANAYPRVVIVGDFNADRETCLRDLGGVVGGPAPAGDLPTRPRTQPSNPGKSQHIDHVFARGCTLADVRVVAGDGLSDHNPVIARVG